MSLLKLTNQKTHSKEIEVDSNIRICYFTVKTNKGIGYVCVALQRPEKGSDSKTYKAAFSSYSPLDEKPFSKNNARNASIGRILNWRTDRKTVTGSPCLTNPRLQFDYIDYSNSNEDKFNLKDVFVRALNLAMYNQNVPSWLYRAQYIAYGLDPVMTVSEKNPSPIVLNREIRDNLKKVIAAH